MTRTEKVGSFTVTDSDGKEYRIDVYQDFIEERTRAGVERIPGMKSLKTSTGETVNRIDKGAYEMLTRWGSSVHLFTDSPDAE